MRTNDTETSFKDEYDAVQLDAEGYVLSRAERWIPWGGNE
jgi:hypothetical protein